MYKLVVLWPIVFTGMALLIYSAFTQGVFLFFTALALLVGAVVIALKWR
jgi:hypothetical protein